MESPHWPRGLTTSPPNHHPPSPPTIGGGSGAMWGGRWGAPRVLATVSTRVPPSTRSRHQVVPELLQRWRRSLASLLLITIFITDLFGVPRLVLASSSPAEGFYSSCINASATPPTIPALVDQCLHLHSNLSSDICSKQVKDRKAEMRKLRLRFCDSFPVYNAINSSCLASLAQSEDECKACVRELDVLDFQTRVMFDQFQSVFNHFDCKTDFSTHWNCTHCKVSEFRSC